MKSFNPCRAEYKRKSLITLGGNKFDDHNYPEAARFVREAERIKTGELTGELRRGKMLAVLKSVAFNADFNQGTSDTSNVVTLPVSAHGNSGEPVKAGYNPFQQPARIIDCQSWKRTMRKESNDTPKDEKPTEKMTTREMLLKLIGLISEKDLTDDQLERMLEAVEGIAHESNNTNRQ